MGVVALVVLIRGVNVGGHKTFRPTTLARQLRHLEVVNIGAAGTFVVRQPIAETLLRAELARRLPFEVEIVTCQGRQFMAMASRDPFAGLSVRPDVVRFVSVLSRRPQSAPAMPVTLPPSGRWLVRLVARDDRFVFGLYRRHMKVISYLGAVDGLFGVPATTRNWKTMKAIANVLTAGADHRAL